MEISMNRNVFKSHIFQILGIENVQYLATHFYLFIHLFQFKYWLTEIVEPILERITKAQVFFLQFLHAKRQVTMSFSSDILLFYFLVTKYLCN